jgi:hypothetical protein
VAALAPLYLNDSLEDAHGKATGLDTGHGNATGQLAAQRAALRTQLNTALEPLGGALLSLVNVPTMRARGGDVRDCMVQELYGRNSVIDKVHGSSNGPERAETCSAPWQRTRFKRYFESAPVRDLLSAL